LIVYGGGLYINDPNPPVGSSGVETTGNLVRPGLAFQVDGGARLAHSFIPYLTLELGIVGAGRRFDGTATNASTRFIGAGFRYIAGNFGPVSLLGDISLGVRSFQVAGGGSTWTASGVEVLRLGFGADIRLGTRMTVSPLLTLTGGQLTDASGTIRFAPNQPDGQTAPLYGGSGGIPSAAQQTYFAVVVGCAAHVDLFGK
jgi:hypothetical protein